MIERTDYHLFMSVLIERIARAGDDEQAFQERIEMMIKASYEIQHPETGRVDVIDVTEEVMDSMGGKWKPFSDVGVKQVCFVRFYILDTLVLETGRLSGKGNTIMANAELLALDSPYLRAFAKAMMRSMRNHGIQMLQEMLNGDFDPDDPESGAGDDMGLAGFIRQFMDEEMDEVVSEFSKQLDSIFSVADITLPPPKGGEAHDLPAPPL